MSSVNNSPKLTVDFNDGEFASGYVAAPLDIAIGVLAEGGFNLIDLDELADLRVRAGKGQSITDVGGLVNSWVAYSPRQWIDEVNRGRGIHPVPKNILLSGAQIPLEKAMTEFRAGKEFYIDEKLFGEFIRSGISFPEVSMPTKERDAGAPEQLIVRAIGGGDPVRAQRYVDLNKSYGAGAIHVWAFNEVDRMVGTGKKMIVGDKEEEIKEPLHKSSFVRPVYFCGAGYCSLMDATKRPEVAQRVRGIRKL